MAEQSYRYIIIGAGLAGASAAEAIRQRDADGSILMLGAEPDPPYNRPPLSKQLWSGKQKIEEIFVQPAGFYAKHAIEFRPGVRVTKLDAVRQTIGDSAGNSWRYDKLLLATGGAPRRLEIPGGQLDGVCYYRTLGDYRALRQRAIAGRSVLVIGGGFIGSEMAAALSMNGVAVSMLFPQRFLVWRIFPESLARALTEEYSRRGITIYAGDVATGIERRGEQLVTHTRGGQQIASDLIVAGIGIVPGTELADAAGLTTANGIAVNHYLQASHPAIYAAGDNAFFPQPFLGPTRVEHWDNAVAQGRCAGANMAGEAQQYDYLPFFFSDLFEFGYEAVGQIDSRLETFADWQEENKTGVIYYLKDGRLRGAMMCNVWEKVDAARKLLLEGRHVSPADLRGAIR